ncbi:MAG: hypothetical protein V4450_01325 [Bacteroidota bacterium]
MSDSIENTPHKTFWHTALGMTIKIAGIIGATTTLVGFGIQVSDYIGNRKIHTAESNIKTLLAEYYRLDSSGSCSQLSQLFTPLVEDYYDRSNFSHEDIVKDCAHYRNRWAYYRNNIDYTKFVIRQAEDKSYAVTYRLVYRTKKKRQDDWKTFTLLINAEFTPDYKIKAIYEKQQ